MNTEFQLPQGYKPHELPADYFGPLFIEGQMRYLADEIERLRAERDVFNEEIKALQAVVDEWKRLAREYASERDDLLALANRNGLGSFAAAIRARGESIASQPQSPSKTLSPELGQRVYLTDRDEAYEWNGSAWIAIKGRI